MKTCSTCSLAKLESEFHKRADQKDGLSRYCKACQKERGRKYYLENKEKVDATNHKYAEAHRKQEAQRASKYYYDNREEVASKAKVYYQENKKYIHQRTMKRYREDVEFRLAWLVRGRVRDALQGNFKSGSAVRDLGCTIQEFRAHLEKQFRDGMTWENQGGEDGWQLDHIRPLASFDLTNREEFLKAVHYTNYQPLSKMENLMKNSRWEGITVRLRQARVASDSVLA